MAVEETEDIKDNGNYIVNDITTNIKANLGCKLKEDARLEQFWQKKLEGITGLRHEYIEHGMITDLSDRDVLIEIKSGKDIRAAIGQILTYDYLKRKSNPYIVDLHKIIVVFDANWNEALTSDYRLLCKAHGIDLVIFQTLHIETNNFEPLLTLIRCKSKSIGFREKLQKFRRN